MTKLITIQDRLEWVYYINNAAEYDFYHTWNYHSLDTAGTPILFVYQEHENFIALPLIKRIIPGTVYCDLSCVYGYPGPLSNKKINEVDACLAENFKTAFLDFLAEGNFISVFCRMHPFFKQHLLLEKFGSVHDNGQTVVIDLALTIENQRKNYSKTTMENIRRAWKNGYTVKEMKGHEAIAIFEDVYTETMKRVGASEAYLFNYDYFFKMLNTPEYDARILIVYNGDKAICGTLVTFTNGIIEAHLLGTRTEYLCYSPTKLLVDEVTQLGRASGMRYFHLGGGLGFKNDSLFNWKASFSRFFLDYKSWRYIVNPAIYQQLLDEKGIDKNAEVDFFPLYRYLEQ